LSDVALDMPPNMASSEHVLLIRRDTGEGTQRRRKTHTHFLIMGTTRVWYDIGGTSDVYTLTASLA
jgi:hypothetical protein